jgi:hypothetical protein
MYFSFQDRHVNTVLIHSLSTISVFREMDYDDDGLPMEEYPRVPRPLVPSTPLMTTPMTTTTQAPTTVSPETTTMTSTTMPPVPEVKLVQPIVNISVVLPGVEDGAPTVTVSVPVMATLGSVVTVLALVAVIGIAVFIRRRHVSIFFHIFSNLVSLKLLDSTNISK